MALYIHEGELITCENGHPICRAARDIRAGDSMHTVVQDFYDWRQAMPQLGTPLPISCEVCGEMWINYYSDLHTSLGWARARFSAVNGLPAGDQPAPSRECSAVDHPHELRRREALRGYGARGLAAASRVAERLAQGVRRLVRENG